MGFTNTTAHYSLPQYLATDKPKYLTDFNQTMEAIDTQMYTNAQAAATADGKAVAAKDVADGAVSSIGTLNTQINGDALDPSDRGLAGDVSDNSGAINTINSLIGNGTPTTTDKTIIGAINEIYADITGGGTDVTAGNVSYDNTTSGLTADDVQEAIDEINAKIPAGGAVEADDVVYDNTTSGLTAINVQDALDELAQGGAGGFTLVGSQTGTTPITLPTGATEAIVYVKGATISTWDTGMCAHILTAQGKFNVIAGYYLDSSSTGGAEIRYDPDTNTVFIHSCYIGSSDATSTAVVTVYAK